MAEESSKLISNAPESTNTNDTSPPPIVTNDTHTNDPIVVINKEEEENKRIVLIETETELVRITDANEASHDEEVSNDTEDEEKGSDDDDDEEDSSFAFDLMDEDELDEMHQHRMTVRDELKRMHDDNNPLWKLMSARSMGIKSRRNVFGGTQPQTRVVALKEEQKARKKDDNSPHILRLETTDFDAAEAELSGATTFAKLNDNKSATIRAIDTITRESKKQLDSIAETECVEKTEEDDDDVSVVRRLWYIVRCFVVIYLYVFTLFEFAFIYKRDWTDYIGLFVANWICDVFLWCNLWYEYLHYRDDIVDSSHAQVINERNEAEAQLDAMRNHRYERMDKASFAHIIETMSLDDANVDETSSSSSTTSFKLYRLSHALWFDLLVNFPLDMFVLIIWSDSPYFIIARLIKLLHSRRFFEYFAAAFGDWITDRGVMRSAFVSRLCRLIVSGIAWLHLWSCIWFFFGSNLYGSDPNDTWLTAYYSSHSHDEHNDHIDNEYLWTMYFVTVTFSTVGYGDIVPMNYFEMVLLIVFQSINYVFITIFVAELAPLMEEFCYRQLYKASQHRMLRAAFESMHIAQAQRDKLLEANRYRWRHQYGMEEDQILAELPRSLSIQMKYQFLKVSLIQFLKESILKSQNKKLEGVQAQQLIPAGLLRKIADECQPKTYIRDQVIASQNVENDALFLLIDGKVNATNDEATFNENYDNYPNFFGHESFWKPHTKSQYTYTAQTMVCLFVISSQQIRTILAPHPKKVYLLNKIFDRQEDTVSPMDTLDTLRRRDALLIENSMNKTTPITYKYTSLIWDILNAFCIIFQAYSFIWGCAFFSHSSFDKSPYKGPLICNWCIDLLFVLDIALYHSSTRIVYFYPSRADHSISRNHLLVDIVCCIPFELLLLLVHQWYTMYIYLLRVFKFARLRYLWLVSYESYREVFGIVNAEMTKLIVLFISCVHLLACVWYLIGSVSLAKDDSVNWIRNDPEAIEENDDSISITRALVRSYYFVLVTITTIGYGGIVPFSLIEQLYDVLLVVSGSIAYWMLIAWFTVRASHRQGTRIEHTNLVSATEFLLQKQHPSYVQQNRLYLTDSHDSSDEVMARLQNYFDFVLHQREGAVSFWDGATQKPLVQAQLRYELLNTALDAKKVNDPSRYRWLEWIPHETMLCIAHHLEWIVVCKGQTIKLKQSGNNSIVLLLVSGTLWSPYSKYVFTRHTKQVNRESNINKSNIITFNLECLSPINIQCQPDHLSTYLTITHTSALNGLYEIINPSLHYQVVYQQIPPDQQQRHAIDDLDQLEIQDLDEVKQVDRTLILLVYIESKWLFISIQRRNGALDEDTQHEIASYPLTTYIDAKEIPSDEWTIHDDSYDNGDISISDELLFEALECCDVVQLRQSDFIESFQTFYTLRFEQYLQKASKMRKRVQRGSILSPRVKHRPKEVVPAAGSDNVAHLIINDSMFAQNQSKRNVNTLKSIQSSHKTLPQFQPITVKRKQSILLRQETLIDTTTTTQRLQAKDVIERFRTEEHVGSRSDTDHHDINTAWVEQVEAIVFDDEHRILKIIWYFCGLLLVASSQFVLPMRALFANDLELHWFWFDIVTQIFFIFDLFVEWTLFKKREKQRQSKKIRKSLFVLDFVLAIPWTFIGLLWSWKVFYFLRLFDLLRIKSIKMYWNGLRHELVHYTGKIISIHAGLAAVIYHIFALFLIASYCACLWYIIGITQDSFRGEASSHKTWVTQETKPVFYNDEATSGLHYYSLSIYWAMASMSSVGYGDLKPISWSETVFALVALPCMVLFYIQFMGDMASFAGNIERSTKTAFYEKFSHTLLALNRRIEYLRGAGLEDAAQQLMDLKKTIRKYLLSLWRERAGMCESEIYSSLPYFLTRDIAYQCRKKYLHSIPCLTRLIESTACNHHIELCKTIARKLQHHIITRKDELPLDDVYVIENGDIRLTQIGSNRSQTHIGLQTEKNTKEEEEEELAEETDRIPSPTGDDEEAEEKGAKESNIFNTFRKQSNAEKCVARFDVYLPPKANNAKQYKLHCASNLASIYCLPRQVLLEIQMGYDAQHPNYEQIESILENYWYDGNKLNVSNVMQMEEEEEEEEEDGDDEHWSAAAQSKSTHGPTLLYDDEEGSEMEKYKDFYYLLYDPKRKILRRSHPFRMHWDLWCAFALFLYALILPLQISNVFYTQRSMIVALIVSSVIDIVFICDFVFRLLYFAPHGIKKLDPFYVVTGQYIDEHCGDSLKRKYIAALGGSEEDCFRDLPRSASDVLSLHKLILEMLAMIPLNVFGLLFGANVYSMNVYFRLNKVIYLFLLLSVANEALAAFIAHRRINFLSARIFRISVLTIVVLHWMSCIWLQLASFDDPSPNKTWLNQMDAKRVSISTWSSSPGYAYLLSLYFVAVTMTTTGYGDITPVTRNEIGMTNLLIILGDTLMALMAGVFMQYISSINKPSLDIAIKERSITHYLDARSKQIGTHNFDKLIDKVKRYFGMQLDYQHRVSTIRSLTQHLPLYYRMKLLHTLFESLFRPYPALYKNKRLYQLILDNVREQVYTYWHHDDSFEFIVDPQQSTIGDFLMVQFGQCLVYSRKEWHSIQHHTQVRIKRKGDLIGFRSLILQHSINKNEKVRKKLFKKEKPKCVITPAPSTKIANHQKPFQIVSILRIKQNVWQKIMNDVFAKYDDRIEFEEQVKRHFKQDI